jgi:hypothetical protein
MYQRGSTNVPEGLHECIRGASRMYQRGFTNVPEGLHECINQNAECLRMPWIGQVASSVRFAAWVRCRLQVHCASHCRRRGAWMAGPTRAVVHCKPGLHLTTWRPLGGARGGGRGGRVGLGGRDAGSRCDGRPQLERSGDDAGVMRRRSPCAHLPCRDEAGAMVAGPTQHLRRACTPIALARVMLPSSAGMKAGA